MAFIVYVLIILTLLIYNKIYFSVYREKVIFFKYLKSFVIYTFLICLFVFIFFGNLFETIDNNFYSINIFNLFFMFFLVLFFNISTKSYESPTVLIYNLIKKMVIHIKIF